MKLLIIGLLLMVVIVSACAPQQTSVLDDSGNQMEDTQATTPTDSNGDLTQEDLNQLKQNLENLEFEDLEGLE